MTVIAFVSSKGSPGVTTFACVLGAIWPPDRDVMVVECDPSGGDLASRFGLSTEVGMTSLVIARRHGEQPGDSVEPHLQRLPGGLAVLSGPVGGDAAAALDRELPALELRALGVDCDLLVDCGRLVSSAPGQHSVLGRADVVVLVTRPDASAVTHARWAIDRITALGHNDYRQIALLTVGEGPFDADELAGVLKVELLGSVPHDPASAAILRGEPGSARVFGRSSLVTRAQHLLGRLPLPNPDEVWRHAS